MKGFSSKITKAFIPSSIIQCADNSGAYEFKMIHIIGKTGGKHGKLSSAGVGDIISASVTKGTSTYLKKPCRAIIIRQKQLIRRSNGMRLRFEDNAAIMVNEENLPIGTEVKGAMAREVVERYVKVAGVAQRIV